VRVAAWRRWAAEIAILPLGLRLALLAAAVLHGIPLSWGMPASDGWDVDGVAPRDNLPGLAETYTPGHFYTYPPLHLAIVAVLTLPVTLAAAIRAGSVGVHAVLPVILATPYMTAIAMTARALSFAMSLAIVLTISKVAEECVPAERKRAAATAAAWAATADAPFTYYAHVTNVDVPYLFWAWLATLALVRAIAHGEPRRLRATAVFAALAVATKDQAYAAFLLSLPVALGVFVLTQRSHAKAIVRESARALGYALAIVLVVDGALTNPSGFRARLAFLSGSASKDYAGYSTDRAGLWAILADIVRAFHLHYPWCFLPAVTLGIGVAASLRPRTPARIAAAFVPLMIAVSFTLSFNLIARRVEERFTLPQMLVLALYAGLGIERLFAGFGARAAAIRWPLSGTGCLLLVVALGRCVLVDTTMVMDPRYDAERWLRANAGPEDGIEVYGRNVYLLRLWPGAHAARVGPAEEHRSPMPGIVEVEQPLMAIAERGPRFAVVNDCHVWPYFLPSTIPQGRITPASLQRKETDAAMFFQGLFAHRLRYHLAHESRIRSERFPRYELHASIGCPIFIFERD
jgi:hypothetical protein